MMKYLSYELKQQIEVEVSLYYSFSMTYADEILRIAEILKECGLKPVVSDGSRHSATKDLLCKGSIDLLTAEHICDLIDDISTHASITYIDGSFILTE